MVADDLSDDPGIFAHVWIWFLRLSQKRKFDGMSGLHQAIEDGEVLAWSQLTRQPIAAHELRLLDELDAIFIREERAAMAEKSKQDQAKADVKRRR